METRRSFMQTVIASIAAFLMPKRQEKLAPVRVAYDSVYDRYHAPPWKGLERFTDDRGHAHRHTQTQAGPCPGCTIDDDGVCCNIPCDSAPYCARCKNEARKILDGRPL